MGLNKQLRSVLRTGNYERRATQICAEHLAEVSEDEFRGIMNSVESNLAEYAHRCPSASTDINGVTVYCYRPYTRDCLSELRIYFEVSNDEVGEIVRLLNIKKVKRKR